MVTFRGLDGRHAVLCIVLLCAWLGSGRVCAHGRELSFDLPAQPLERALEQFSIISGWSVMYPATLADGRTSRAVQGAMPPSRALEQLLAGSGLAAQAVDETRVVLRELAGAATTVTTTGELDAADRGRRFGQLQYSLRRAFCDDPLLAPGDYSADLTFRVADDGRVHAAEMQAGSGDPRRDQRLLLTVAALELPVSLAALPQPVRLHIQPVPDARDCGGSRQSLP